MSGCFPGATPPPIAPDVPPPSEAPLAIARDPSELRPLADLQRERLRGLIDLAERRELHEGGPRMLKVAKEESRTLDRIEARIDDAMRLGSSSSEVDELQAEIVRCSDRLDHLDHVLR